MDSFTQIVLGAAVAEAVVGSKVGNKALLYGAIAGTIPDLDTLAGYFVDPITAIEFHRGLSHSILFALVLAPLLGWLVFRLERRSEATLSDWTLVFLLGFLTHAILDSFTTWGTALFWPLDWELAFKSIFVIDPLYTLPLTLFLILLWKLPKESLKRRRYNWYGLGLSTFYLLITLLLKSIAHSNFKSSLIAQDISFQRLDTRPTPFNTILWTANVETDSSFLIGYWSFFDDQAIQFEKYPKNHHLLDSFLPDQNVERMQNMSNDWYSVTQDSAGLYFNDLRFGKLSLKPDKEDFVFSYRISPVDNGPVRIREREKHFEQGTTLLWDLFGRIWGN